MSELPDQVSNSIFRAFSDVGTIGLERTLCEYAFADAFGVFPEHVALLEMNGSPSIVLFQDRWHVDSRWDCSRAFIAREIEARVKLPCDAHWSEVSSEYLNNYAESIYELSPAAYLHYLAAWMYLVCHHNAQLDDESSRVFLRDLTGRRLSAHDLFLGLDGDKSKSLGLFLEMISDRVDNIGDIRIFLGKLRAQKE